MQPTITKIRAFAACRSVIRHAAAPAPAALAARTPLQVRAFPCQSASSFSTTASTKQAKNQIFDPVRNENTFHTYLNTSNASNRPLITLWTASWCSTCRVVEPQLRSVIESGAGEAEGGVNYVVVEFDAPDTKDLVMTYMTAIRSVPTLLAFDARRGEPMASTKVSDARQLADRQFLVDWVRKEASRHGGGGGGGGGSGSGSQSTGFGGLFGSWK